MHDESYACDTVFAYNTVCRCEVTSVLVFTSVCGCHWYGSQAM